MMFEALTYYLAFMFEALMFDVDVIMFEALMFDVDVRMFM